MLPIPYVCSKLSQCIANHLPIAKIAALLCVIEVADSRNRKVSIPGHILVAFSYIEICRTLEETRKRCEAQRITRLVFANATVYLLLTYKLIMLLPPSE